MRVEIAQGVVAALGSLNLGLDATRGHFASVRHLVALRDEDQGMRGCCDPAAACGLKLVDEARLKKMSVPRRIGWFGRQDVRPNFAPDQPLGR